MARYRAVRGTFDLLPQQVPAWVKVENTARELAHRFGFREIRTPLFEQAELFTRGMGVMSGLIEKELWTFQDKFGQKLALRADMTSGVVRAYQENKLYEAGLPQKMFYLAPVFLLGKEGEERSRQSHQFGFEALGSDSPALDAEVIALAASFCDAVGLEGYSIRLNSLGGADCRPLYQQKLRDYFGAHQEQLCPTCKRKFKAHPDWVLSCEESSCKQLAQVAPTIYGMLSNGAKQHFAALREYLEEMELPVELDPRVVRDSEYYNRTVFEIRVGDRSLGFGGRYDSLVEKLGGKSTPAVGFALSLEAVMDALAQDDALDARPPAPRVYFQPEGPESSKLLVPLMNALRQRGVAAELDYRNSGRGPGHPPEGCSYTIILDESNAFRGHAILKDLDHDKEEKVSVGRLRSRILQLAGQAGGDSGSSRSERDHGSSASNRKKLKRGGKRQDREEIEERDERQDREETESRRERRTRKLRRNRGGEDSGSERQDHREEARDKDRDRSSDKSERDKERADKDRDRDKDRGERGERDRSDRSGDKGERDKERDKDRDRDKDRGERERSREKKRSRNDDEGDGKAIVPAFNLGGLGRLPVTPQKVEGSISKGRSPEPEPVAAAKASKGPPTTSGGGLALNWSILPGKEAGKDNGKTPAEKGGTKD
jgi:histidyl-tRNA synthetase